jgi:opacity protein-like surface antigen
MCVLRTLAGTLALIGVAVSAGQPFAAEIRSQPSFNLPLTPAPDIVSRPVELGSGWYLRGNLGLGQDSSRSIVSGLVGQEETRGFIGAGLGYKQNNWMRYDFSADYNRQSSARRAAGNVVCPYGLAVVRNQITNIKFGYLWDETRDTCTTTSVGTLQKVDFLGNFYIDLGTWARVTPYVGAGLGISVQRLVGGIELRKTSNGQIYNADLRPGADSDVPRLWVNQGGQEIQTWTDALGVQQTGSPPIAFDQQNGNRTGSHLRFRPAFALMLGFSFDVSEQLKGEVSYRYLNAGQLKSITTALTPNVMTSQLTSQQLMLGFRFMID